MDDFRFIYRMVFFFLGEINIIILSFVNFFFLVGYQISNQNKDIKKYIIAC